MVLGFGVLVLATLFLVAGFSGRSLAEVVRGEIGRGFALANISLPSIETVQATPTATGTPISTGAPVGARPQGLKEVFHDPLGYYFDNGRVVNGAIGGHGGHVHVAAEPVALLHSLAELGQNRFNLTIREEPHYDPVDPVHTSGSFHYRHAAFDASGSPADMLAFARYLIGGK